MTNAFPDPRLYRCLGPRTAAELGQIGEADILRGGETEVVTVADAARGGPDALTFAESLKHVPPAPSAVIVLPEGQASDAPASSQAVLVARSPKYAFARMAAALFESRFEAPSEDVPEEAAIDPSAKVHPTASVGPGAVVGAQCIISPHAVIGTGVTIGAGTFIGAGASVTHAHVGERCRIAAGARIGEAGFGYAAGPNGPVHLPQLGAVIIGNEVDIGANTTIDRGMLSDTEIDDGTKIDNLCQIGHNCRLGRGVLVASQTGISGSCVIGDSVMMGGKVGLADHLTIGEGAVLAAGSGLMKDVEAGGRVGGYPARPLRQWMKETAALTRLTGKKT